ncbi:MAG: hypothetical protein ACK4PI_07685 [Tepidisphaerales bacterium]
MHVLKRLVAASSFSALIVAALLIWSAYQRREDGASPGNLLRLAGATAAVVLAVVGTRLRHRLSSEAPPPDGLPRP